MVNIHLSIIGSGISGLTAGCALLKQGYKTTIYEKLNKVEETGAGITLSGNATRLLERLGLLQQVKSISYMPKKIFIREFSSGNLLGSWNVNNEKDNKFLTLDRRALVKILLEHYLDFGGALEASCGVSAIDPSQGKLKLLDGREVSAEIILGCDGIKSLTREHHFDDSKPVFSSYSAWRGIADRSDLPGFQGNDQINIYYGPDGHVVHYPIGNQGKVNFVGVRKSRAWTEESWKKEGFKKDLLKDFDKWNSELLSFMTAPKKVFKWGIFERPRAKTIQKNKLVLLGDAAHPMVPFIGQGGCMAIEDAYTFGLLFSKLEDLKEVFFLYEKLRLKRGNWMQARSRLQARFNHLSNPILVELRKLFIGAISQKAIKSIHSYDAHKEVMKQITG